MMIRNKKGIVLKFLLGLLFTIISLFTVIFILKSCIKITSPGEESFNQLIELIEKIKVEGGAESMPLRMDRKTALIGFASDSNRVICRDFTNKIDAFFNRPVGCEANKACICLCQSGFKAKGTPYYDEEDRKEGFRKIEYECKKIKCNSFESIDFLEWIDENNFGSYPWGVRTAEFREDINFYRLIGGFIHTRNGPDQLPGIPTNLNDIFVEKYKNIIGICFKRSCIPDEIKKQIDEENV